MVWARVFLHPKSPCTSGGAPGRESDEEHRGHLEVDIVEWFKWDGTVYGLRPQGLAGSRG